MSSATHLSVTQTARVIREALKRNFPKTKFSVRRDSYADGASIDVYWFDGPTEDRVNKVVRRFEGASFDGMQDLKTYHSSLLSHEDGAVEEVHFGVDYVFTHRKATDLTMVVLENWFEAESAEKFHGERYYNYSVVIHDQESLGVLAINDRAGSNGLGHTLLRQKFSVTDLYPADARVRQGP